MASIEILHIESQEKLDLPCLANLYTSRMELKDWVREVRAIAGMTQTQLGDVLGLSKGNISGWENGRHEPSYGQVIRMAELSNWKLAPPSLPVSVEWPFRHVTREQWMALDPVERGRAETKVEQVIEQWESSRPQRANNK